MITLEIVSFLSNNVPAVIILSMIVVAIFSLIVINSGSKNGSDGESGNQNRLNGRPSRRGKTLKVQSFKQPVERDNSQSSNSTISDFIFWYIILDEFGKPNGYYSSPVPVTDFSGIEWNTSDPLPIEIESPDLEKMDDHEIESDNGVGDDVKDEDNDDEKEDDDRDEKEDDDRDDSERDDRDIDTDTNTGDSGSSGGDD